MSIYRRLSLLLLGLVACSLSSFVLIAWFQARSIDGVLQDRAHATAQMVERVVAQRGEPLTIYAKDYTLWDDMGLFVQSCDPAWAATNLEGSLGTFQADGAWVLRPDGSLCYGMGEDPDPIAGPAFAMLRQPLASGQTFHVFTYSDSALWEIAAATIHPTADTGRATRPQGWFVVAQRWDDEVLDELGGLLNERPSLTLGTTEIPPTSVDAAAAIVQVNLALADLQGQPVAHLHLDTALPIAHDMTRTSLLMLAVAVVMSLLMFALLSIGLSRLVIAPLATLTRSLQVNSPDALHELARQRGEFAVLARLVQRFFAQRDALAQEVGARQRAEGSLRAERDFALQVMHAMGEGLTVADTEGRFTFVNEAYTRLFGHTPEWLLGRTAFDVTPEEDHAALRDAFAARLRGERFTYQTRLCCADGHIASVQITGAPRLMNGAVVGTVTVITDLSERLAAEAALRRRDAILQAVSQAAARFLSGEDWEAHIDAVLALLGAAAEATQAYLFTSMVAADGAPMVRRRAVWRTEGTAAHDPTLSELAVIEAGFGRWAALLGQGTPICGSISSFPPDEQPLLEAYEIRSLVVVPVLVDGVAWGFLGCHARDSERPWSVAEVDALQTAAHLIGATVARARISAARRDSEARFRAIWEHARDGMALIAPDGTLQLINPAGAELCGYPAASLIGQPFSLAFPAHLRAEAEAAFQRYFQDGAESYAVETTLGAREEARRRIEIAGSFLIQEGRRSLSLVIARDITQRRQAEEERRRFEQQLQEAQRLEGIGILAGGVAHDFNNLLAIIMGHAELLSADVAADSPTQQSVTRILSAAQRAADMTRQLLAYAGKGRLVVQPMALNDLVAELRDLLATMSGRRAPIVYELTTSPTFVVADRTQLSQILINLVMNASEATENGAALRVSTRAETLTRDQLDRLMFGPAREPGPYLALSVADQGHGMDDATRQRIFEPFFTTKFTGRGLGLAAVQGIVNSHQGVLQVLSAPGRGTTITIWLPAITSPAPASPSEAPSRQLARAGSILVIDDEAGVREIAKRALERIGVKVYLAADGAAGLALAQEHGAELRAVLLDMSMPQMNGEAVARSLATRLPALPVVLMSGYSADEIGRQYGHLTLAGVLQKPFTLAELQRVLARVKLPSA